MSQRWLKHISSSIHHQWMKELNINILNKTKINENRGNWISRLLFFSQAGTRKRTRRDEIKIIINIASTRATVSRTQWRPYKPVTILCAFSVQLPSPRGPRKIWKQRVARYPATLSAPLPYTAATIYTLDRKYNNGKNENKRWNTLSLNSRCNA